MKNNVSIFYRNYNRTPADINAENEAAKELAIQAAVEYAGFDPDSVTIDRVELSGGYCRVDFRYTRYEARDYRSCGMSWCSYVDAATGEVVGFAGSTERACADMEETA